MTDEYGNDGGRTIGYDHVSISEQDLRLQLDALKKHGVLKDMWIDSIFCRAPFITF